LPSNLLAQVELKFTLQMAEENGMAEDDKKAVAACHAHMQVGAVAARPPANCIAP
jgi:hypothetical protein